MLFKSSVHSELARVLRGFDRLFAELGDSAPASRMFPGDSGRQLSVSRSRSLGRLYPAVESLARDGRLVLRAELPGVERDAVQVTVEDGRLVLSGEKKSEREERETDFLVREMRYGRFERSFILPNGVKAEDLQARMKDGVLEVSMPIPAAAAGRKIEIEADGKEAA